MGPIKDLRWRALEGGELALRWVADGNGLKQIWLCHRGDFVIPLFTVPKSDSGPIYEKVVSVLGPSSPFAPLYNFDEFERNLLDFTKHFGLPREIGFGSYDPNANHLGQLDDVDGYFGLMPLGEWLDWAGRLRAALMLLKLSSLYAKERANGNAAGRAEKELKKLVHIQEYTGTVTEDRETRSALFFATVVFPIRVYALGKGVETADLPVSLEQKPDGPPVKLAAREKDLGKLASFAAGQLISAGLQTGVRAGLAWHYDPKRSAEGIPTGCYYPQFKAKHLAGETWLQLSEQSVRWEALRVCELEECSSLFYASKRGGKDLEKRFCSQSCKRRAHYLKSKVKDDG